MKTDRSINDPNDLLTSSVGYSVTLTFREIRNQLLHVIQPHNIDYNEWIVLRILWNEDGHTQKALCELTATGQSTMVATLKKLTTKDLIKTEADAEDGRSKRIYLTERSIALKEELLNYSIEYMDQSLAGLSEKDIKHLQSMLKTIRTNCRIMKSRASNPQG